MSCRLPLFLALLLLIGLAYPAGRGADAGVESAAGDRASATLAEPGPSWLDHGSDRPVSSRAEHHRPVAEEHADVEEERLSCFAVPISEIERVLPPALASDVFGVALCQAAALVSRVARGPPALG